LLPIAKLNAREIDLLRWICSQKCTCKGSISWKSRDDQRLAERLRGLGILNGAYHITDRGLAHVLYNCKIGLLSLIKNYGNVGITQEEIETFRRIFETDQALEAAYRALYHQYIRFDMWDHMQRQIEPQTQVQRNIITNECVIDLADEAAISIDMINKWLGLPQKLTDKEQAKRFAEQVKQAFVDQMKADQDKQYSNIYVRTVEHGKNHYMTTQEVKL